MPSLEELVRLHTDLGGEDLAWLQRLVGDWQMVADLSFADLVLWLPDREGGYRAGAQMRPTTGPTAYLDDVVGERLDPASRADRARCVPLDAAMANGRISREGDPEWRDDVPVRVEAIPVRRADRVIAVVARSTNLQGVRTPSRLELTYLQTAGELSQMIANGSFPTAEQPRDRGDLPRVGDGFIRVDPTGTVTYASPNGLSVYRRLGLVEDLTDRNLAELTRSLVPPERRPPEEVVSGVLGGRVARSTELDNGSVAVLLRSVPLRPAGEPSGAFVLLRDVTEVRRRDRELVTKDATIREIHHRVKNNLQTVAALLRLQSRRLDEPAGRAALDEAVRRVTSIAIVHETLSTAEGAGPGAESVDFDGVVDQLRRGTSELGVPGRVSTERAGSFGVLDADVATPLAMALTELLQNAVEHGFAREGAGRIVVHVQRDESRLVVEVRDDGAGVPAGFDHRRGSLGLSIVSTLVAELGGSLRIAPGERVGTTARLDVPLAR